MIFALMVNFMMKHARGLICVPMTAESIQALGLDQMNPSPEDPMKTAFTVSVDAKMGVTTGISAYDRNRTIELLADTKTQREDLVIPGHIFPLKAVAGGVLVRAGHTEAGCDLTRMAGLTPAAVICEILKADGTMARLPDLIEYGHTHKLKIGTIADLIQYRSEHESVIERVAAREIQTAWGTFQMVAYRDTVADNPHIALISGQVDPLRETLVRVHEPTSMLDVLDVHSAGHTWGVAEALEAIKAAPAGVMVFLNCQGSAQHLFGQISAWPGQETAPVKRESGRMDLRTYGMGAQILRDLKVGQMRLMARPRKMPSIMPGFGLDITGYDHQPPTRNT
jgi:3,4-dihydroxy 2-butanone 4-phosphate synthase/GTP cyclohydrolase II